MSKLRKAARGRHCMVRLPCCNGNPETTVLAHLSGGGMGRKRHDLHGAWACSACHDALDGRTQCREYTGEVLDKRALLIAHLQGMVRTQEQLIEEGLIKV